MRDRAAADRALAPRVRPSGDRGLRRMASQAGLMVALVAVVTVCATAAGTGALLLTAGTERALSAAVAGADGSEESGGVDVTSVIVTGSTTSGLLRTDAADLLPVIRRELSRAATPYRAQVSLWASTPMLYLDGADVRCGYLLDADTLAANASLLRGSWPTRADRGDRIPVALPSSTADALDLDVGAEVRLSARGSELATHPSYALVVTGIFAPAGTPAWARDTLRGRGYDPDYLRLPTFGPFAVAPGSLEGLAAPVARVAAVMDPDLGGDAGGVPGLLQRVDALATRLQDAVGPAVNPVLVWSALGQEFGRMRVELGVTDALVLAVFFLVLALGATTAALLARVLLDRRRPELALLRDRGASGRQLVLGAAVEALVIAAVAAAAAAPLAVAAYRLTAPFAVPPEPAAPALPLALGVALGAGLPAIVLVVGGLPERARRGRQVLTGPLARSGLDVMLAATAVVAYLQLRTHSGSATTIDPLLATAPTLCVVALAALSTRLLPGATRLADVGARRSRAIILPLVGWFLARGGAARSAFLIVLATATATLGVTFLGTWSTSQADQAAAVVGADLVVARPGGPGTAGELGTLTGGTVAAVSDRAVVLGSRPDGVRLVALDAAAAPLLLTSRPPDGVTWADVLAGLEQRDGTAPLRVAAEPRAITVTGGPRPGSVPEGLPVPAVSVTPTLVLADDAGTTVTLAGASVPLDGRPHTTPLPLPGQAALPPGAWRVVAIDLHLVDDTAGDLIAWGTNSATMQVGLQVVGATSAGGSWDGAGDSGEGAPRPDAVAARGDTVQASFSYSVLGLSWQDAHLTLLSFPASTQVPVAMTGALAGELGLVVGDRIALAWGTTPLEAQVARILPYVPGHPREDALLADLGSLQRALLSAGLLEPTTDAWWVGTPRPGAAEAVRAAGQGPVLDREELSRELRDGPLRAPLPVAWLIAVAASVGLAITGSAAQAAGEARRRGTTIARVRALGASRRESLASHLAQHAAVTVAGVVLGVACGVVLAVLLAPLLVLSPAGRVAVPAATLVWSVAPTTAVIATILLGGIVAGVPAALSVVRRSTASALRAGEAQ